MEKSEIITPECAKVAVYERLTKEGEVEVEIEGDEASGGGEGVEKKNGALALLGKVLRLKKTCFENNSNSNSNGNSNSNSGSNNDGNRMKKVEEKKEVDEAQEKKTKKRSSWLPDPEKRWPVQGWS